MISASPRHAQQVPRRIVHILLAEELLHKTFY